MQLNELHLKAKPFYALLFFIILIICYRIFGYTGHFGFDDMQYAEIAANLLDGKVDFEDHFTFRFTIIAATALSYKLFGINDFASSLPAMTLTILTLVIVYVVMRKQGFLPTIFGLAFTTTSQWLLFYSNKLMPDIYLVFFTILATYIYFHYRYESQKHVVGHAIAFSVTLLFGFMSKGTVVLLLPWLLYLFFIDFFLKKETKFWKWVIVSGTICLIFYFASIKYLTGEFFYRFKAIAQNSYLNKCSYDQQPMGILLKRLFFDFFDMTINYGMSVPLVFVVTAFISKGWRQMLQINNATSFFLVSAMLLFLSSNFMTISGTSYIPMCIDPRHYLFIIPIASIASALFLHKKPTKIQIYFTTALFVFLSIYSFFGNRFICYYVYMPITLVMVMVTILKDSHQQNKLMAYALLLTLLVLPCRLMAKQSYQYNKRRNTLIDMVVNNKENNLVISDMICTRLLRYYDGFSSNSKYIEFSDLNEDLLKKHHGNMTLVLNYHTLALNNMTYDNLPDFASFVLEKQTPVFDKYGVKLYQLDSINLQKQNFVILFKTKNNFDSETPDFWREDCILTQKTSYSGNLSNEVGIYSATFTYPLDSFIQAGYDVIFVNISAYCNCYANTNCAIVVSIENTKNNFCWNSAGITGSIIAYSHWYKFDYTYELHLNGLPSDAMAVIYFYKTDKTKVYIDDFSINFCKQME